MFAFQATQKRLGRQNTKTQKRKNAKTQNLKVLAFVILCFCVFAFQGGVSVAKTQKRKNAKNKNEKSQRVGFCDFAFLRFCAFAFQDTQRRLGRQNPCQEVQAISKYERDEFRHLFGAIAVCGVVWCCFVLFCVASCRGVLCRVVSCHVVGGHTWIFKLNHLEFQAQPLHFQAQPSQRPNVGDCVLDQRKPPAAALRCFSNFVFVGHLRAGKKKEGDSDLQLHSCDPCPHPHSS